MPDVTLSALDFDNVQVYLEFFVQIIVAAVGAVIGWFVTDPIFRVLYRLAFARPAPPAALTLAKCAGALALGLLIFFAFRFGMGGSGGGEGGGVGTGKGKGTGSGDTRKGEGTGKYNGSDATRKSKPGEELDIELIVSDRYQKDDRWYLIERKEPPRTLTEVDAYVKDNLKRLREINIIIYSNSPEPHHYAVRALEKLAEENKLRWFKPDYQMKEKK